MIRRSRILKTLGIILSCTMAFNMTVPVCAAGTGQENTVGMEVPSMSREAAEAAKGDLENNMAEVNDKISGLEAAKGSLEQNVAELDGKLNDISQRLQMLSADLSEKETQIEETQKLLDDAKAAEKEQYEAMKKRIQFMYENGNTAYVEMLLEAQSMADLLNRAEYITNISDYDRGMLEKYQETKELIVQKEEELRKEYEEGQGLHSEVSAQQSEVESVMTSKQDEISQYNDEIAQSQTLAQQYADEVEAQNNVLSEIVAYEAQMRAIDEENAAAAQAQAEAEAAAAAQWEAEAAAVQAQAEAEAEAARQQAEQAQAAAQAQSEAAAQAEAEAAAKQAEAEAAAQAAQQQQESEAQAAAQAEAERLQAEAEAARQEAEQQKQEAEQQKQDAEQQQAEQQQAEQQQAEQQQGQQQQTEQQAGQQQAEQQGEQQQGGSGSSGFIWPTPSSYVITSEYGYREAPTEGATSDHKGIDIGAPYGADILAAASGTVMTADYITSAGNYIIIYHGNGLSTVYMHASALFVTPGQTVNQGDVIAAVGSTGYSTGPHLHFGITENGLYINPHNYMG